MLLICPDCGSHWSVKRGEREFKIARMLKRVTPRKVPRFKCRKCVDRDLVTQHEHSTTDRLKLQIMYGKTYNVFRPVSKKTRMAWGELDC